MRRRIGQVIIAADGDTAAIGEVYIAVVNDSGTSERIFTIVGPSGERIPLVAIDQNSLAVLRQFSQQSANEFGETVSIIAFTQRSLRETFRPLTTGDAT